MARGLPNLISPNEDINYDRENAVILMKKFNKEPHPATKDDIRWFWEDLDLECEKELAWDYVGPRVRTLSERYPFLVSEWFVNWYRFMPDIIEKGIDGTGQIDWNLFFTLAFPLPGDLAVPFCIMIEKLNIAQLREVKQQIVDEIWNDKEMRKNIFNFGNIPTIYTYYMPYQTIRNRVIEKDKKYQREHKKMLQKEDVEARNRRLRTLHALFRQVDQLQKEGKEVILIHDKGIPHNKKR